MAETNYSKILTAIGEIKVDVGVIREKLVSYPDVKKWVGSHDTAIKLLQKAQEDMENKCSSIQADKKGQKISWGDVKGKMFVGIVTAVVVLVLNIIVALAI
jgi:hypothetical protein